MTPERLITRLASALVMGWIRHLKPLHCGDMTTLIVFSAIFDATSVSTGRRSPWSDAVLGTLPPPEQVSTAYAIAAGLDRPYKTIRRKIDALVGRRLLVASGSGVRIANGILDGDPLGEAASLIARSAVRMQRRFAELGLIDGPVQTTLDGDVATRFGAINGFALNTLLALNKDSGVSINQTALFLALGQANTKHLGRGDCPPYQSYHEVMPVAERRPVTALALAEELAMPRETTRRRLWDLVDAGLCSHVRGGFIVNEPVLHTEQSLAKAEQIRSSVRRLLQALK